MRLIAAANSSILGQVLAVQARGAGGDGIGVPRVLAKKAMALAAMPPVGLTGEVDASSIYHFLATSARIVANAAPGREPDSHRGVLASCR
jgi:hypothetical protein